MRSYRRPLLALATALAVSSLMSACVVVPARGYYRYPHRYHGQAELGPTVAPQQAAAPAAQG